MLGQIYPVLALLVFADVVMKASCTEKGSLTFVVSDTESMKDEIDQIKNNVNKIEDIVFNEKSSVISNMVLVSLNRSDAQVKAVARNRDEFDRTLKEVYAHSIKHVTCREPSMDASIKALNESNRGSHIYVFTDASPRDYQKADIVKDLCQKKQSQISFVFTGSDCTWTDKLSDTINNMYNKIAQACAGLAYEINRDAVSEVFKYITDIASGETVIITARTVPAVVSKEITFEVDNLIEYVIVSVLGKEVELSIDYIGTQETLMWNANSKVLKLVDLKPGETYTAVVKGESETSVNIVGRSDFFFKHGFSQLKPKLLDDTSFQPLIDIEKHFLSVLVSDVHQSVDITKAQILGMNEEPIKPDLPLTKISKDFYVTEPFITPTERFKVAVIGRLKATGHIIKRIAKISITPSKPPIEKQDYQIPKVVIAEGNETSVDYNSSLTLTCKVTALPRPTITWYDKKGKQIPSKSAMTGYPADYISYLEIAIAVIESYMCRAVNDAGTNSATINVAVMDAFTVVNNSLNIQVEYGKPYDLRCDIKSKLPMKTRWYHINEISGEKNLIFNSDFYTVSADEMKLTIKKMDFDLVGKYVCSAYLVRDRHVKTELSRRVRITGTIKPNVQMPAVVKAVKGLTAILDCNVTGVPKPTTEWQYKNKSDSKFVSLGETRSLLRINNINTDHEGQYKCVAENPLAKEEKVTTLIVQDIPTILSSRSIIHQAIEGDANLKIPCVAIGNPKPRIIWKMDGRAIAVPNSKYTVKDGALVIKNPKVSDTKPYVCVAINEAGSETATFKTFIHRNAHLPGVATRTQKVNLGINKKCSAKPGGKTMWLANSNSNRPVDVCVADCKDKKLTHKPL